MEILDKHWALLMNDLSDDLSVPLSHSPWRRTPLCGPPGGCRWGPPCSTGSTRPRTPTSPPGRRSSCTASSPAPRQPTWATVSRRGRGYWQYYRPSRSGLASHLQQLFSTASTRLQPDIKQRDVNFLIENIDPPRPIDVTVFTEGTRWVKLRSHFLSADDCQNNMSHHSYTQLTLFISSSFSTQYSTRSVKSSITLLIFIPGKKFFF